MDALILALGLIFVHGPDGQEIEVNVAAISSIRQPRKAEGHFAKGTHCLIEMSSGKFISTVETCPQIVQMVKGEQQ